MTPSPVSGSSPAWIPPLGSKVRVHNPHPCSKGTVVGAPFVKNGSWRVSVRVEPMEYLVLVGGQRPKSALVVTPMLNLLRPA